MPLFTANGKRLEADLFVLDKDGLMFSPEPFWIELVNERCRSLLSVCSAEQTLRWAHMMGADTVLEGSEPHTTHVDPLGIVPVASPYEEKTITAAYLVALFAWPYHEARDAAAAVFQRADQSLNLTKALKPQPGFVRLMRRLAELDIPYGVATSDTLERTRTSMALYNCWEKVRFVITPEDVNEGKPAPDMLLLASRRTGVPLDRIAMVGDSYVDVKMAFEAGSIGIGVSDDPAMRKRMAPVATVVLKSLEELTL